MRNTIIFIIVGLLLVTCNKVPLGEDYVFVRHKAADMPVWVRGNTQSDVFIIYIHDGPGGSSFIDIQNDFFAGIEERYAMVYYDQRSSGNSIGHSGVELLTIDQFVEDLDVIVQYVQTTYAPPKVVLMGHGWGGTLGSAYLLTDDYQSKIAGWIEVDGGHNLGQKAFELSRDYVMEVANNRINRHIDEEGWQSIIAYYNGLDNWRDQETVIQHRKYVHKAGGYFFDDRNMDGLVGVNDVLTSETDFIALSKLNEYVLLNMDIWHLDYTNQLNDINVPVMILWGKADGMLPLELAYDARDALKLNAEHFYVFQESAHSPHYEETVLFNQKVISFIQNDIE